MKTFNFVKQISVGFLTAAAITVGLNAPQIFAAPTPVIPGIPPGAVMAFALAACPTGYSVTDGTTLSRTGDPGLFAAMGTRHGSGDGSTTYNKPDYRGRFLRGWANGSTLDPDRASRVAMATGGVTGDQVGSVQGGQFASHTHALTPSSAYVGTQTIPANFGGGGTYVPATGGDVNPALVLASTGGNENRPVNAYVIFCIKL